MKWNLPGEFSRANSINGRSSKRSLSASAVLAITVTCASPISPWLTASTLRGKRFIVFPTATRSAAAQLVIFVRGREAGRVLGEGKLHQVDGLALADHPLAQLLARDFGFDCSLVHEGRLRTFVRVDNPAC